MPKRLNVNLSFTADTQQAKAQLQDLQNQLTKITANAGNSPLGLTKEISTAIVETTKLQTALQKATTSTGSLDLGAFKQELQKTNLSAEKIASTLISLGPEGQAAFAQLAQSISLAEVPIRRTNGLLTEFATTLKNTVRWQISSSILHGFIGSLESAYGYAQDLNESLTNIRIVTGQSVDEMAKFAEKANASAKALSTTTTAYTDAALIFYQQGLSGKEVTDRTDTVIKMANVTGDSAEEVSSYMTAIWNNFYDGSVSLEHYADVITALGAATASSSAEISEGLSKFASVADTIGLSYDYATSILAALVANTRQSADVIGTSLKTILARLQSVKLGETLEDGVELTKYTSALNAIGVSVLDLNGNLRDADDILDDTAAKWDTLTKAQQASVAQTVAGTRQYSQFIAMMANWGDVEKNLQTAQGAEGTLQEQADIYAESWEAAQKRVRAAAQGIYQDLLDDDFFIDLTNSTATITESIGNIIDALGGLKGVLPFISSLLLKTFDSDIAKSMDNFAYNIKLGTQSGRQAIIEERQQWNEELIKMADNGMVSGSAQVDIYREQANVQNDLIAKTMELQSKNKDITSEEEMQLNYLMDINARMGEEYALATQNLEELKAQTTELENQVFTDSFSSAKVGGKDVNADSDEWNNEITKIEQIQSLLGEATALKNEFVNLNTADGQQALQGIIDKLENYQSISDVAEEETRELREALESLRTSTPADLDKNIKNVNQSILNLQKNSKKSFNDLLNSIEGTDEETKQLVRDLKALADAKFKEGAASTQAAKAENNHAASVDNLKKRISELEGTVASTSQRLVAIGSGLSSFAMMLSSIRGVIDTINNPDLSGWEKFVAILGSIGMTITMSLSAMKQLHTALGAEATIFGVLNAQKAASNALDLAGLGTTSKKIALNSLVGASITKLIALEGAENAQETLGISLDELKNLSIKKQIVLLGSLGKEKLVEIGLTEAEAEAIIGATVAQNAFNASLLANPLTWIVVALVAAAAAVVAYTEATKKANEQKIADAKAAIEEERAIQSEVQANRDLYKAYLDTNNAYLKGIASKEDMKKVTDDLTDLLGKEEVAVAKLTGDYESLTDKIIDAQQAAAQEQLDSANREVIKAQEEFVPTFKNTDMGYELGGVGYLKTTYDWVAEKDDKAVSDYLLNNFEGSFMQNGSWSYTVGDLSNPENILDIYHQIDDAIADLTKQGLTDSDILQHLKEFRDELQSAVDDYENAIQNVFQYQGEVEALNIDYGSINSLEEFIVKRDELVKQLQEIVPEYANKTDAEMAAIASGYIQSVTDTMDNFIDRAALVDGIIDNLGEETRNKVTSTISSMSDEDLSILATLDINSEEFLNNVQYYIDRAKAIAEGQDVEVKMASIKDVESSLNSDKELTDKQQEVLQDNFNTLGIDQSWAEFDTTDRIDQMEVLSQLSDELIEKNNEYIKGLEETAKQAQVEKETNEARVEELTKRLAELKKSQEDLGEADGTESWIRTYDSITSEIKEIDEELEELSNKEYNIDIDLEFIDDAIFDNFETKVDSILSEAEALKTATELIGEGWQVAAEDAKKLADVYPELMEGAEVLTDGIIQLNQDKINAILVGNSEIIAADKETTASQLESQIALLDAEIEYQQTKLEILQNLLEGKINETDAEKALQEAESKFEEQCIDAVGEADANATNQEVANHIAATDVNLKNLDIIDQRIAEISQHYSKMLSGEIVTASTSSGAVGGGTATYSGGGYTTNITDNDLTNTTVDEIKAQIQATQDTLDTLQNQRADYTALLSELRAGTDDAIKAIDRVQSGKAGKEKSSGRGKTPEHKTKENVDKFEADPFHKVNQELEDIEHNLKMINKQQSHMFGKELINNLKQQNAQLKIQTELHREKLSIAQQEADALRAQLEAQGVAFDGDNIANYNAMLQAAEDQINILIAQYNALSAAEQEAWDKAAKNGIDPIKQAENRYEELKKQMDNYVNYMSIVYSEEEAIQDALFQQIENNLKAYQVEIELKLDTTDAERALNKFLKNMRTDIKNLYKTTSEWADVFNTAKLDAGTYVTDTQTKIEQLNTYKNASYGSENDIFATESEKYQSIVDLEKELLEDSENILNLYQDAYDSLLDAFGEVADQFNDILDEFDRIDDTLDHYEKVIELLYGGSDTERGRIELDQLYKIRKENSLAEQNSLRQYIQALEIRKQQALANGLEPDDSYIRGIEDEINNANDKLTTEIEDYIDTIQRELENSIKMAQNTMDKNVWGDTTENVYQEWDDKKAQAEGYYDTVERIYQLESLESKWKAAILNTSSLKAQQQLTELMDKQVAALENKTVLSEKDIELAEKELQVYQAQIALEDAQNNKNSMKLTRDETGNWSYQYVADEGDIASKQEDYLNKINEWRTASINAAEEIAEKTMEVYEVFSERMSEIMNDVTLSEEERDIKIQELNETYWGEEGIITRLVEDSNYIQGVANRATYTELESLYLADQDNVTRMTEEEQSLIERMNEAAIQSYTDLRDFISGDDGKSGVYGEIKDACIEVNKDSSAAWKSMAADAIGRMYKDPDSVKNTVNLAYKEMITALAQYDTAIIASEKASGRAWSNVDQQLLTTQSRIQGVYDKVDAVIQKSYELNTFEQNIMQIKSAWEQVAAATQAATQDLLNYMSLLASVQGGGSSSRGSSSGSGGRGGSLSSGGGQSGNNGNGSSKSQSNNAVNHYDAKYNNSYLQYTAQAGNKTIYADSLEELRKSISNAGYVATFATGGYTGDWLGGDGRFAMLHSKELVLNAEDTKNMLAAVQVVRDITSIGTSVANAISNGISNMIRSLLGLKTKDYSGNITNNEVNEGSNTFEITMNVDGGDVEEIQRAILDLPNLASQFLSKK